MTVKRFAKYTFGSIAVLVFWAGAIDLATFDREQWLVDYSKLKTGLAQDYANLDWIVAHRGFDPAARDRETIARLNGAFSNIHAYFIVKDFVRSFRDPHLHIAWGNAPPAGLAARTRSSSSQDVQSTTRHSSNNSETASCREAVYENDDTDTELNYPGAEAWQPVDSAYFPAGMLGIVGIIRIAHFGENKYADACDRAYRVGMSARELQLATRAILSEELLATIERLKSAGAEKMMVDVTGNGGGSEWSREVASMFAAGPLTRYQAAMPDPACDRSGIWSGETVCSSFAWPPAQDVMEGQGNWDGPLAVLIDNGSASATEDFVVWLRDNDKAVLMGTRTYGAGCGFIDGGRAVQFEAAPFHIMMPNCARFTREGRNEIEGLEADIAVDWTGLAAEDFRRLFGGLGEP